MECKPIGVDEPRAVSISKELPAHLKCEPALYPMNYTDEWDYVAQDRGSGGDERGADMVCRGWDRRLLGEVPG